MINSEVGPKLSVCAPITVGLGTVTSRNFSTWRAAGQA